MCHERHGHDSLLDRSLRRIDWTIAGLLILFSTMSGAWGGQQAQQEYETAKKAYADELLKLQDPSGPQAEALRARILVPAEKAYLKSQLESVNQAQRKAAQEAKEQIRKARANPVKDKTKEEKKKEKDEGKKARLANGKTPGAGPRTTGASVTAPTDSAPREEVVVDGGAVPAEIEFPGPQKKAAPTPNKTTSPVKTRK